MRIRGPSAILGRKILQNYLIRRPPTSAVRRIDKVDFWAITVKTIFLEGIASAVLLLD